MLKNTLAAVAFGAATLFAGTAAMAAPAATSCSSFSPDVTDYVTNTSACFVLTGTDGNVSNDINEFNATNFDGHADWVDLGKVDPYGTAANFKITGDTFSGTSNNPLTGSWEVFSNAITQMYSEFVLVFKAGQDQNTDPSAQVGYVIDGTSGEWKSMLFGNKNPRGISHVSLYGRGSCDPTPEICGPGVNVVPVPAGLPLLLSALGLGVAVRRFKKRA